MIPLQSSPYTNIMVISCSPLPECTQGIPYVKAGLINGIDFLLRWIFPNIVCHLSHRIHNTVFSYLEVIYISLLNQL